MNASFKKTWEKQKQLLQDNVKEEINFFKKPVSLEVIINDGILLLTTFSNVYLEKLKSSVPTYVLNIEDYIKTNDQAKYLIKISSNIQSKDFITLISACSDDTSFDSEMVNSINVNFDDSIDLIKLSEIHQLQNDVEFYIFCLYFINYLIFLIIDAIQNVEIPSLYRTKYLQNLLKTYAAYMKQYMRKYKNESKEIYDILKSLATIDALVISIVGASYFYLSNRKKSQQNSLDNVNKFLSDNMCSINTIETINPSTSTSSIDKIDINYINVCDSLEEDESPTLPIINEEFSCESLETKQEIIDPILMPDLITNAFIENKTSKLFSSSVSLYSHVTTSSSIATLDASTIYSPIEGFISKLSKNKIYIKDISDYDETDIEKITNKLSDNYKKIFDIIEFIKKYNVYLSYPIMLSNPGNVRYNKFSNIRSQHTTYNNIHQSNLTDYTNKVQDITKCDNITSYLESGNVDEIKFKIDKETEELLKKIKNINDTAYNTLYNTIPVSSDYVLFDYYMLLYTQLNTSPNLTEIEKLLKYKILEFKDNRNNIENSKSTNKEILIKDSLKLEYSWIKIFLDEQWKQYSAINDENIKIQNYLSQLNMFSGYGVVEEDGIKYRSYNITDATNCDKNIDEVVKPNTENDLYTYKYWLKYLSYITLVGSTDLLSWSTGLILPTGPVKLPVIYTPIIPIKTAYGFILIGLTICGIYVCPFITYNNMTLSHKSITGVSGIISIKDEIQSIKNEINHILSTLKVNVINPILQNIKDELTPIKEQIITIRNDIKTHNAIKPNNIKNDIDKYEKWEEKSVDYKNKYKDLNTKKFKLQLKYKIVKDFGINDKINSTDTSIEKINSTKKTMNNKLDRINSLIDKIDSIISALPTALAPNSINFGSTIKNPKLVIQIETDTDVNIDTNVLDNIFTKHKKSNEDLMKHNFDPTYNNLQDYYKIIKSSMNVISPNEPYPTYDRISPTNLGFLNFAKRFVKKGAKTFGIPGQPPFP